MPTSSLASDVRWAWDLAPWATALVLAGVVAWVVALYAREQEYVTRRRRAVLAALRLAAVAILLAMLAQPTIERRRVARPRLALVLDRSASMATADVAAADLAAGDASPSANDKVSRQEAWRRLLTAGDQPLVERLAADYDIDVVLFDSRAERLAPAPDAPLSASIAGIKSVDPKAPVSGTRLGDVLDFALRQLGGPRPAAVVAMTDGISTEGLTLTEVQSRARTLGVPIYAVALGSDRPRPDVSIADVLVEDVVFPGDRLQIEASLAATGFDGKPARIVLKDRSSDRAIGETELALPSDGATATLRLALRPVESGPLRLELTVDAMPGEDDVANNRAELTVDVRAEPIRALLADSTPSYEYRALKSLLERDPAIDLRVYLQDADADYATVDERAVHDFPASEAELLEYDVVLLGDVDPDLVPRQAWDNLQQFVSQYGGGLAVIAGPKHMPQGYAGVAAMRTLLPLELTGVNPLRSGLENVQGFSIEPTAAGLEDPSLQLGETPQQSSAIWEALPPVLWLMEIRQPKPGANVLAVHPLRSDDRGEPLPVILRQYVGAGEVLLHATDESWRWRRQSDDRYFARYWGQAVRRLARGRVLRGRGSISTNKSEYAVGEPVTLRVRTRPAGPTADDEVTVELESATSATREIQVPRKGSSASLFELALRDLPPDRYTARLVSAGNRQAPLSTGFVIAAPPHELARLVVDATALAEAADATGGKYYTAKTARRLPDELPAPRPTVVEHLPDEPLWNNHWLLAALCLALGAEWLLRRRAGML